jgi:MoaA/NifB/PqqE/SkfB family radical SAM enzyme
MNKKDRPPNSLGQLPFPTSLAFEPIQLCNATCFCCPYSWLRNDDAYRGKKMSRDQIELLLDDFGGIRDRHKYNGFLGIAPYRFSDPLVCKDLGFILEKADKYRLNVAITTNGIGLDGETLALLDRFRHLFSKIVISLIGATTDDVKDLMGIKFPKVLKNIENIADNWPNLKLITRVSMRRVTNSDEELYTISKLKQMFELKGINIKFIKDNWITNRVNNSEFVKGEKPVSLPRKSQTTSHFIYGCGWSDNLLNRMEVMVDGDVVLCCDDAEKNKVFGNAFEDGLERIWTTSLRKEHQLIMEKKFSIEKESLICNTCSRAKWSDIDEEDNWAERLRFRNRELENIVRKFALLSREKKESLK